MLFASARTFCSDMPCCSSQQTMNMMQSITHEHDTPLSQCLTLSVLVRGFL